MRVCKVAAAVDSYAWFGDAGEPEGFAVNFLARRTSERQGARFYTTYRMREKPS